jgi:HPt (histidine-containing phosphotransfer) domain-containing protein
MSYQFGSLDASMAAALGDDTALMVELRDALISNALEHADLLSRSRCDANWWLAAHRLKGLAASFGAADLAAAADDALVAVPGDPVALRGVRAAIEALG